MRALLTTLGFIALTGTLVAQSKGPGAQASNTPAPAPLAVAPAPLGSEDYSYQPEGRRDPFLGLVAAAGTDVKGARRGDGLAAFTVGEISVRGVMQSRTSLVAMIKGPDNRTYLIHQGDKLADGVVKSVTPEGLVVLQDISDPLSTQKQREVRKLLRSLEDAKEKL
jgi:Tfp pilus assembly protein PilP